MENIEIPEVLAGISAASILIGLALFGLTLGNAVSAGIAMREHVLFLPAMVCMGVGILNLVPIILSDSSMPKNEKS